jgi:hypothetical protein
MASMAIQTTNAKKTREAGDVNQLVNQYQISIKPRDTPEE